MELRQLKYFVKVAETLNFSEASRGAVHYTEHIVATDQTA